MRLTEPIDLCETLPAMSEIVATTPACVGAGKRQRNVAGGRECDSGGAHTGEGRKTGRKTGLSPVFPKQVRPAVDLLRKLRSLEVESTGEQKANLLRFCTWFFEPARVR